MAGPLLVASKAANVGDAMLQPSLQVLAVHEIDSLPKWERAAQVVRSAAEAGADLASRLDILRRAFLESHSCR